MKQHKTPVKFLDCSMPNEIAYKLGEIAREVGTLGNDKAGDEIDRGLILVRRLCESGYSVVLTTKDEPPPQHNPV